MRDLPWQGKRVEIHLQARRFRCRNNACEAGIRDDVIKDKRVCSVGGGLRAAIGDAIGRKSFADGDVAGEVVVDAAADDEIAGKKLRLADENPERRGSRERTLEQRRND
jgi:transposase